MTVDRYTKVAKLSDLRDRRAAKIIFGDEQVALWRVADKVYAVNNICPHQHFPVLHEATLEGIHITCPMHGWTYSLETGKATSGGGRLRCYEVKIVGDDVFVENPSDSE